MCKCQGHNGPHKTTFGDTNSTTTQHTEVRFRLGARIFTHLGFVSLTNETSSVVLSLNNVSFRSGEGTILKTFQVWAALRWKSSAAMAGQSPVQSLRPWLSGSVGVVYFPHVNYVANEDLAGTRR